MNGLARASACAPDTWAGGLCGLLGMHSASYETDVAALVKVGATIWDLSSRPVGAHDPAWVPPFVRQ
ncbi:hypothetical protein D3C87_1383350 [compost metagenome]